jgi:hypothetical protein
MTLGIFVVTGLNGLRTLVLLATSGVSYRMSYSLLTLVGPCPAAGLDNVTTVNFFIALATELLEFLVIQHFPPRIARLPTV